MKVLISILPLESQRFSTTLDGIVYQMTVRRNPRNGWWTIDWEDSEGEPLVSGMRIVPHYDSLEPYVLEGMPPGQLWAVDPTGENAEIPEDFSPYELVYVEAGT